VGKRRTHLGTERRLILSFVFIPKVGNMKLFHKLTDKPYPMIYEEMPLIITLQKLSLFLTKKNLSDLVYS